MKKGGKIFNKTSLIHLLIEKLSLYLTKNNFIMLALNVIKTKLDNA